MKLPGMIYSDNIKRSVQVSFGGYCHTPSATDGDIYDMKNLSSDNYPLLSPRKKRYTVSGVSSVTALFGHDKLLYVSGTQLFYDGVYRGEVAAGEKSFAALGGRIVIFPDKKLLNVTYERLGTFETLASLTSAVSAPSRYDAYGVGASGEYDIYVWDGNSWVNNGRELSSLESEWQGVSLTFKNGTLYGESAEKNTVYNASASFGDFFRKGDAVTISGCAGEPENNKTAVIREISADGHSISFSENCFKISGTSYTETSPVSIKRAVPDMTDICASDNRLWGCSGDTIYASALGDPTNFFVFDGTESDSWACETGTKGSFTACVSYLGYPMFFKEDLVCKVYGSLPSNFSPMTSATFGVLDGAKKTLAVAGETLYYLSRAGIAAYTGGIPRIISKNLGDRFVGGASGSDGVRYYASLINSVNESSLFVYDTSIGTWYREDNLNAGEFAWCGELYASCADGKLRLLGNVTAPPAMSEAEGSVAWYAEFGDFTHGTLGAKSVSRLLVRMELAFGASVTAKISYDSGEWETVGSISAVSKRTVTLPILPRRADNYRLRLEGTGDCRIYSLAREYVYGSTSKTI